MFAYYFCLDLFIWPGFGLGLFWLRWLSGLLISFAFVWLILWSVAYWILCFGFSRVVCGLFVLLVFVFVDLMYLLLYFVGFRFRGWLECVLVC